MTVSDKNSEDSFSNINAWPPKTSFKYTNHCPQYDTEVSTPETITQDFFVFNHNETREQNEQIRRERDLGLDKKTKNEELVMMNASLLLVGDSLDLFSVKFWL